MKDRILFLVPLLMGINCLGQIDTSSVKKTIHFIVFSNTNDKEIGNSCYLDYKNIDSEAEEIKRATNLKVNIHNFIGDKFSLRSWDNLLKHIKIGTDDFVFLYFSTHGGRGKCDSSVFPFILLSSDSQRFVNVESLHNSFRTKFHPRFLFTMIDACNNVTDISDDEIRVYKKRYSHEEVYAFKDVQIKFYKHLFKYSKGDIIITSSQPGIYSLATPLGSLFTNSFLKSLHEGSLMNFMYGANWNWVLGTSRVYTINDSKNIMSPQWKTNVTLDTQMGDFDDGQPSMRIYRKDVRNDVDQTNAITVAISKFGTIQEIVGNELDSVIYTFYENKSSYNEKAPVQRISKDPSRQFEETFTGYDKSIIVATLKYKDGRSLDVNTTRQMYY